MNHRTVTSCGGTRMNRRCGSQLMMNMWWMIMLMIVTMVQGNHHYHSAISRAARQWSWHHHRTNTPPPLLLDDMTRTDRIVIPATTTTSMMFLTGGRLGRGGGSSNMGGVSEPTTTTSSSSSSSSDVLVATARLLFQTTRIILTTTVALVGPPLVTTLTTMIQFYRQCLAWDDAIVAQIGLLYAFCGGYYPTLFAAVQAAQHTSSGIPTLVTACHTLYDEATSAIRACEQQQHHLTDASIPSPPWKSDTGSRRTPQVVRDWFLAMTRTVLATIDPVRINDAVAAIGTTWMSIAVVLEREFARTIALSVALAEAIRPVASVLLNLPLRYCLLSPDYDQWRPVLIGWLCKALAMSVAWRIQRVLTAYTSAICGGLVCSRALGRILQQQFRHRRRGGGNRRGGRARSLSSVSPTLQPQRNIGTEAAAADPTTNTNHVIEFFGYVIAVCGLYSQIGHGFSFQVPFPLNLVTWPLDWAERWIQWQITKKSETT